MVEPQGRAVTPAARLCLIAGLLGAVLLALNHITATAFSPALGRADVVGSLMAVALMLVGLNWTRVDPDAARPIQLEGQQGLRLREGLTAEDRFELAWGSDLLLRHSAAVAVHVIWDGTPLLSRGLLQLHQDVAIGPIAARVLNSGQRVHLVDLKHYPGKDEFSYLPPRVPAVLVAPIGHRGLVVLAGATARCFDSRDLGWCDGWVERLRRRWECGDPAAGDGVR
ncbi:MAG: cofactor assembly of complex C subunit B [Aphanocapsa feldmannii 277cV]|uniref:Cofactor assembly of complex C subunit B n=2 Tax=Aphanocapsa feldmannii TaxID=192050 RepID=A0A524RS81_9CHRO|nr:MAG: cofactor assembly of complex C subunit B [Aphanocapsa feldmannii 277cV]TGH22268.1 MAG: cofactor assembly of complex C subunit B [Aphanocapsa feldmannii 277cI]